MRREQLCPLGAAGSLMLRNNLQNPRLKCTGRVEGDFGRAYVMDLQSLARTGDWETMLSGRRKDHRCLRIIEETIRQDFEYHYLVLEDTDGRVRDVQPFFVHTQDLLAGMGSRVRRIIGWLRKLVPNLLTLRTLMVGSPTCEGHLTGDPENARWCARAMHRALERLARQHRASMVVLKEFPSIHRKSLGCFTDDGYTRIASMPYATLDLDFADFEHYLQSALSKSFRKNLRRKFKCAAAAGQIEMQTVDRLGPLVDEVYPLYLQVYERAELKFEKLTKEYLRRMGEECPDKTRFFIWRHKGRAVAFSACTIHDQAIWDEYLGLDYSVALDLHLYFVTFRDLINWACAQGLRRYYTTALNYDPKLHLKCDLVPLDLYVRHTNSIVNVLVRPFLKLLGPTRGDPVISRFPNANEL